jgi:UDPglucose 6-dehydrogenase
MRVLDAVLESNEAQPLEVFERLRHELGSLAGRRVAVWGVSFKPGTSDIRETRALPLVTALRGAGCEVVACDPVAADDFAALAADDVEATGDPLASLDGADACVLHTAWPAFRSVPAAAFGERMRTALVVDARRFLDGAALRAAGVAYVALGDGSNGARSS